MTAKHLPKFEDQLMSMYRKHFLESNLDMPNALTDREIRNRLNVTRAKRHQASRNKRDSQLVKAAIQSCWGSFDSIPSLNHILDERIYFLAPDDRFIRGLFG